MTNDANKGLTVEWNYLQKPYRVTTAQSITTYRYDPLGRRLSKVTNDTSRTLYARDPQGNALANYRSATETDAQQGRVNPAGLVLSELVIYGSSRIGIINLDAKASPEPEGDNPGGGGTIDPQFPDGEYSKSAGDKNLSKSQNNIIFTEVIGLRRYEISNHLGNVLATYTDRKLWRKIELQDGSKWEGYDCDVASGTDYHAYGFAMAGRTIQRLR